MSPLKALFTSEARIEILRLLLFNETTFHIREIARRTNISPSNVKRELDSLSKIKVVKARKVGNTLKYSANKNSSVYEALKTIFNKLDEGNPQLEKLLPDRLDYEE